MSYLAHCWWCEKECDLSSDVTFKAVETDEGVVLFFCNDRCLQKHIRYWIQIFSPLLYA